MEVETIVDKNQSFSKETHNCCMVTYLHYIPFDHSSIINSSVLLLAFHFVYFVICFALGLLRVKYVDFLKWMEQSKEYKHW